MSFIRVHPFSIAAFVLSLGNLFMTFAATNRFFQEIPLAPDSHGYRLVAGLCLAITLASTALFCLALVKERAKASTVVLTCGGVLALFLSGIRLAV